jgi:hypothetical protein
MPAPAKTTRAIAPVADGPEGAAPKLVFLSADSRRFPQIDPIQIRGNLRQSVDESG